MYPSVEAVINDLKTLKDAIGSGNLLLCEILRQRYCGFVPNEAAKHWQAEFMRTDKFASNLLPQDIPNGLEPKMVIGDGNCLYNAVSVLLVGNERLSLALRLLAAAELCLHAHIYAHHPK